MITLNALSQANLPWHAECNQIRRCKRCQYFKKIRSCIYLLAIKSTYSYRYAQEIIKILHMQQVLEKTLKNFTEIQMLHPFLNMSQSQFRSKQQHLINKKSGKHTFIFEYFVECIESAFVDLRMPLNLDTCLDYGEWVQQTPDWERAEHWQWEKLVFVHHIPFNSLNVMASAIHIWDSEWLHGSLRHAQWYILHIALMVTLPSLQFVKSLWPYLWYKSLFICMICKNVSNAMTNNVMNILNLYTILIIFTSRFLSEYYVH